MPRQSIKPTDIILAVGEGFGRKKPIGAGIEPDITVVIIDSAEDRRDDRGRDFFM